MKYFAYGVNMLTPKMVSIITFSQAIGIAELSGYRFDFNKQSHKDESAHANIVATQNAKDKVYGVVYEFSDSNKEALELAENVPYGYHAETISVVCQRQKLDVVTYLSDNPQFLKEGLVPFTWYKAMIVRGAKDHELPKQYIQFLEAFTAGEDSDTGRAKIHARFLE